MSIRVTAYTIAIGAQRSLEIAQGEDREFRLTFTDPDTGTARDMTGATAVVFTVRNRSTGLELFSRSYSGFQGAATAGTPRFQILAADTSDEGEGFYDAFCEWTDASGYVEQLLVESVFEIVQGGLADVVTTPPAIPVVYGIGWSGLFWTGKSGGYNLNDGVMAYDGSLGATAVSTFRAVTQGVTHHPMTGTSPTLASGWAWIGQHGGAGSTGSQGVTGATGPAGPAGSAGSQGATGAASNDPFAAVMATSVSTGMALKVAGASLYGPLGASGGVADSAQLMVAIAQEAASGSGVSCAIVGPRPVWIRSDGASSLSNGQPVIPSPSMAGFFRQGLVTDAGVVGIVFGTGIGATLGGLINVL